MLGIGSLVSAQNVAPTVKLITPTRSDQLTETYVMQWFDANGATDISKAQVLINSYLDGANACYFTFDEDSSTVYLVDNAGPPGYTSKAIGQDYLSNSQCRLETGQAVVERSQNTVRLTMPITFTSGFGKNRVVYSAVQDGASANSGWQIQATVNIANPASGLPTPSKLTPFFVWDAATVFHFNFAPVASNDPITRVQLLMNDAINGISACYVAIDVPNRNFYLFKDSGDGNDLFPALTPAWDPSLTTYRQNSQCIIYAHGSEIETGSDGSAKIRLNVRRQTGFSGKRGIWTGAQSSAFVSSNGSSGANTGWLASATWEPKEPRFGVDIEHLDVAYCNAQGQNCPVLEKAAASGAEMIRLNPLWRWIEPCTPVTSSSGPSSSPHGGACNGTLVSGPNSSPTLYHKYDLGDLTAQIDYAAKLGMKTLLVPLWAPAWANSSTSTSTSPLSFVYSSCGDVGRPLNSTTEMFDFSFNLARLLAGRVQHFGVWNEPDHGCMYDLSNTGISAGNYLNVFLDRYFDPGVNGFKAAIPPADIVSPELLTHPSAQVSCGVIQGNCYWQPSWLNQIESQRSAYYSIVSVHSYRANVNDAVSDVVQPTISNVSTKPVWTTEIAHSDSNEASLITQTYTSAMRSGATTRWRNAFYTLVGSSSGRAILNAPPTFTINTSNFNAYRSARDLFY